MARSLSRRAWLGAVGRGSLLHSSEVSVCLRRRDRASQETQGALGVPPAGQGRLRELGGRSGPHKSAQASRGSGAESAVFKPWDQPSSNQGAPPLLPEPWQGSLARLTRAPGPRAQGPAAPWPPRCAVGPPQEWPRPASPQILEPLGRRRGGEEGSLLCLGGRPEARALEPSARGSRGTWGEAAGRCGRPGRGGLGRPRRSGPKELAG